MYTSYNSPKHPKNWNLKFQSLSQPQQHGFFTLLLDLIVISIVQVQLRHLRIYQLLILITRTQSVVRHTLSPAVCTSENPIPVTSYQDPTPLQFHLIDTFSNLIQSCRKKSTGGLQTELERRCGEAVLFLDGILSWSIECSRGTGSGRGSDLGFLLAAFLFSLFLAFLSSFASVSSLPSRPTSGTNYP